MELDNIPPSVPLNTRHYRWSPGTALNSLQELEASNQLAEELRNRTVDGNLIKPLTPYQIYRASWHKLPYTLRNYLPPLLSNPSDAEIIQQLVHTRKILSTHGTMLEAKEPKIRGLDTDANPQYHDNV